MTTSLSHLCRHPSLRSLYLYTNTLILFIFLYSKIFFFTLLSRYFFFFCVRTDSSRSFEQIKNEFNSVKLKRKIVSKRYFGERSRITRLGSRWNGVVRILGRDCARSVDDQQVVRVGENLWLQRVRTFHRIAVCQRTVPLNQDNYTSVSH